MIYTAGLNTGSPEKAAANFLAFALVMAWATLISMLPFWTPIMPPKPDHEATNRELAEQGFRMGIGTSLALAISYVFEFAKIGWSVSAVGSVVRFDHDTSKKRAMARLLGTLGGALIAGFLLVRLDSVTALVLIGALFAVLNGLYKKAKVGQMPLFYTATILILYSLNDISERQGPVHAAARLQPRRHRRRRARGLLSVPDGDQVAATQRRGYSGRGRLTRP